jgi:hypothetical protein
MRAISAPRPAELAVMRTTFGALVAMVGGILCLDHAMVVGAWRGVWRYVGRGDGAWFRLQSNSELGDLRLGNRKEMLDV